MFADDESTTSSQSWLGTSFDGIYKGKGPWNFSVPPIIPSKYHHVLFNQPVAPGTEPTPHYNSHPKHWDDDHVRMPYSEKSLFITKENDKEVVQVRWNVIREALSKPINSSLDFEIAVNTYNTKLPEFAALHYFCTEVLDEDENKFFFSKVLPGIVKLALRLPELVPGSLPLLKKKHCKSISLSQMQIGCLLANAFLCTFIWRKDLAAAYPAINFVRLFAAHQREKRKSCIAEKLKSICHYFRVILKRNPTGVVTFERKFIPRNQMPRWDSVDNNLGNTKVHVTSVGLIEEARGLLQVDFANKFVGGGVLGYGCVQEEIRFAICPELIVTRLFTEELEENEALVVMGVERFSSYSGYGDTFKWEGNYKDDTPFDEFSRRRTSLAIIDAVRFNRPKDQFNPAPIIRELNKAFAGFSCREKSDLAPVASGNWGCGAFKGDPHLKSLIQLMACTAANRDLVYYSFGDKELRDDIYNMVLFLGSHKILIRQLWRYLCQFCAAGLPADKLYAFIQQAHFDSRTQPTLKEFLSQNKNRQNGDDRKSKSRVQKSPKEVANNNEDIVCIKGFDILETEATTSTTSTASTSKQSPEKMSEEESEAKTTRSPIDIISVIDLIDGNQNRGNSTEIEESSCYSLLSKIDELKTSPTKSVAISEDGDDCMDTDDVSEESSGMGALEGKKKRKITDYFTK